MFRVILAVVTVSPVIACTSIILGRGAADHGSPMTSHASDCNNCDNRIAFVPHKINAEGEARSVYTNTANYYPRIITEGRSDIYAPHGDYKDSVPLGKVEQARERNALWESAYPLMNEHGLSIGESTTYAYTKLAGQATDLLDPSTNNTEYGRSVFYIAPLMAVAMEQCSNARCAVKLMGKMAQENGFTGEEYGTSEAVTIIDKKESWVFEMAGDGSGKGAVWAAQRVPDGHLAAVTNTAVIKEVHTDDPDNYLFSDNLHRVAKEFGLWNESLGLLNWQQHIGVPIPLPRYSSLRLWRIYNLVAPSLKIPVMENPNSYPFSVPVEVKLSVSDVFDLFRDHYEGTQYDMTQGPLAGPFGNPNYETKSVVKGQQPRGISLHRTSYTMVAVAKEDFPVVWYAVDAPASSVFVPFYAAALNASGEYSSRYGNLDGPKLQKFDRTSAFWAFDFVANFMGLNYRNMSNEMVYPKRDQLQSYALEAAHSAELEASKSANPGDVLGKAQSRIQEKVATSWWELADELIVRYNDGGYNFAPTDPEKANSLPLPEWWLRMIGFNADFYRPAYHWLQPAGRDAYERAVSGEVLRVPDFEGTVEVVYAIPYGWMSLSAILGLVVLYLVRERRQLMTMRKMSRLNDPLLAA